MLLFQEVRDVLMLIGAGLLDGDVNPVVAACVVFPDDLMVVTVAEDEVDVLHAFFEVLDMRVWNHRQMNVSCFAGEVLGG